LTRDQGFDLEFYFFRVSPKKKKRTKKTGNEGEKNHRKQEHTRSNTGE